MQARQLAESVPDGLEGVRGVGGEDLPAVCEDVVHDYQGLTGGLVDAV